MKKSGKIFRYFACGMYGHHNERRVRAYADSGVQDTKWDDYAATEFAGGTGTKDDPYRIENGEQLAKLAKDVSARNTHKGEYFRLEKEVDLSAHRWIPIGDYGGISYTSFEGAFWTATVRRYQVWWLIRARINNLLVCLVIYPMQRRATK